MLIATADVTASLELQYQTKLLDSVGLHWEKVSIAWLVKIGLSFKKCQRFQDLASVLTLQRLLALARKFTADADTEKGYHIILWESVRTARKSTPASHQWSRNRRQDRLCEERVSA